MTPGIDLPNIPVPLSRLVLGTMTFGDTVDASSAANMLDAALDAGITGVDTANGYAGGESERILAALLPGRRDRIVLATKAGIPHPDQGDNAPSPQPACGPHSRAVSNAWAPTRSTCSTSTSPTARHP